MYEAERGLFDLRQGRPVYVAPSNGAVGPEEPGALIAAVDGLGGAALDALRRQGPIRLALTGERAASMGLGNALPDGEREGETAGAPISVALNGENTDQIVHLASAHRPFGSNDIDYRAASPVEAGGLRLVRLGRLLPAVISATADPDTSEPLRQAIDRGVALAVTTDQIDAFASAGGVHVTRVSEGPVPLAEAEDARFVFFRESSGLLDHVAILFGTAESWPDPTPVRIHSACLTGDLFGSLKCDCGEQLRGALRYFAQQGGGVLLYMSQEGRGIGLANKLRAYRLQEEGLDTIDADGTLGFGADERHYAAAIEMLRTLGVKRVQLLTNNPGKVSALGRAGIDVAGRMPLYGTLNRHNEPYVKAKVERAGHWLHDMLAGADPAIPPRRSMPGHSRQEPRSDQAVGAGPQPSGAPVRPDGRGETPWRHE